MSISYLLIAFQHLDISGIDKMDTVSSEFCQFYNSDSLHMYTSYCFEQSFWKSPVDERTNLYYKTIFEYLKLFSYYILYWEESK